MSEAALKKPSRPVQLRPARMESAEFKRNTWSIVAEPGTGYDRFRETDYLVHVSDKLKPWDRLEVRAEDGSWLAELVVRSVDNGTVKTAELWKKDFEAPSPASVPATDGFEVVWKGPAVKFRVVRKSDGETIREGFADRETALAWLTDNHLKALAAA